MDKTSLLLAIHAGHAPIAAAAAALTDDDLVRPSPGMPGWTRKDILAHIEWWHRHSVDVLAGIRSGVDPYPGDDEPWDPDAWNARILAENAGRPAADVRAGEAVSFTLLWPRSRRPPTRSCSARTRIPGSTGRPPRP